MFLEKYLEKRHIRAIPVVIWTLSGSLICLAVLPKLRLNQADEALIKLSKKPFVLERSTRLKDVKVRYSREWVTNTSAATVVLSHKQQPGSQVEICFAQRSADTQPRVNDPSEFAHIVVGPKFDIWLKAVYHRTLFSFDCSFEGKALIEGRLLDFHGSVPRFPEYPEHYSDIVQIIRGLQIIPSKQAKRGSFEKHSGIAQPFLM